MPGAFDPRYNLMIDQGDLVVPGDVRTMTNLQGVTPVTPRDSTLIPFIDQVTAYEAFKKNKPFTTDKDGGIISGSLAGQLRLGLKNASLNLPLFQDVGTVKNLLLGNPVHLIDVTLPNLNFLLNAGISIPLDGTPVSITLAGKVDIGIQFGFGFDTKGLQEASAPGGKPDDVRDGFYINTKTSNLNFQTQLFLGLNVNLDVVRFGIEGGLIWKDKLGLVDPEQDGKLRLVEAENIVKQHGFDYLFNNSGSLSLGGDLYITILDLYTKYIQIYQPTVLFNYGHSSTESTSLGWVDNGVLQLDMGPDAYLRGDGTGSGVDESFTIQHVGGTAGNEDVEVSGFGVTQTFHGVREIDGTAGSGNDTVVIDPGVLADAALTGGSGNDRFIYQGSGQANLRGGLLGDDDLEATGPGASQIYADGGNDTIVGGPATTLFTTGASSYMLSDNRLIAGPSTMTLKNVRRAVLTGTNGDDSFNVSDWSGDAIIDGLNGFDSATVDLGGGGTTTVEHSGPVGRGSLTINGGAAGGVFTVSSTRTTAGADVVNYDPGLNSLTVNGGRGGNIFNLIGEVVGTTFLGGGGGADTFNIPTTTPFTYTQIDAGAGNDRVFLGSPGAVAGSDSPVMILGGVSIGGGSGRKQLTADIPGNLIGSLQVAGSNDIPSIHVRGDVLGTLLVPDSSTIGQLTIDGSLTGRGEVAAGTIDAMSIGGSMDGTLTAAGTIDAMSVGGSLDGTLTVAGALGHLSVGGATTGQITAQSIGTISAAAATGPLILRVDEGGVDRQVVATPADPAHPSLGGLRFAYLYDSTGPGNPQLALRITGGNSPAPADAARFDLALTTDSAAGFDLERLDAVRRPGLRNILVEGNLRSRDPVGPALPRAAAGKPRGRPPPARQPGRGGRPGPRGGRLGSGGQRWGREFQLGDQPPGRDHLGPAGKRPRGRAGPGPGHAHQGDPSREFLGPHRPRAACGALRFQPPRGHL